MHIINLRGQGWNMEVKNQMVQHYSEATRTQRENMNKEEFHIKRNNSPTV